MYAINLIEYYYGLAHYRRMFDLSDFEWSAVLQALEELNDPEGVKAPNRFVGYIGETLETLYFMYNKENLRIAHAGCRFLV